MYIQKKIYSIRFSALHSIMETVPEEKNRKYTTHVPIRLAPKTHTRVFGKEADAIRANTASFDPTHRIK